MSSGLWCFSSAWLLLQTTISVPPSKSSQRPSGIFDKMEFTGKSFVARLSQNIAGVTIMALGNGAPDIFSALAGIGQGRPELVLVINIDHSDHQSSNISYLGIFSPTDLLI